MKYKILSNDAQIDGRKTGDVFEAEPHAMELYLIRGQVEEVGEKKDNTVKEMIEEAVLSEREQIKKELREKGIEFKGNAKTEVLRELNK